MKSDIHPEYETSRVVCACGRVTETRGTVEEYHVEICSHCHPFFTGKQKLVDTAGRVERFLAKYGDSEEDVEARAEEAAARAEETEKLEFERPGEEESDDEEAEAGEEPAAEAEESPEAGGGEEARGGSRRAESGASAEG